VRIDYDGRALVASHGSHTPRRIVWHDTESHDWKGIRDLAGIASYWHGVSWGPGAHVGIDSEGFIARYVDDLEIAYHVENHNTGSLGIEIVGFARFAPSVWLARRKQLETVAEVTAEWCKKYDIPAVLSVERGISTHAMQSRAYHGSHTDPGPGFPVQRTLRRVQAILAGAEPKPPPKKQYAEKAYWTWLRWYLGEGEFRTSGPHNKTVRPVTLPATIPDVWWSRLRAFLAQRSKGEAHPGA
jgi:hypothetical protein